MVRHRVGSASHNSSSTCSNRTPCVWTVAVRVQRHDMWSSAHGVNATMWPAHCHLLFPVDYVMGGGPHLLHCAHQRSQALGSTWSTVVHQPLHAVCPCLQVTTSSVLQHILPTFGSSEFPLSVAGQHSAIAHGIANDAKAQARITSRVCCHSTALLCIVASSASPAATRAVRMPSMQRAAAGSCGTTPAAWMSTHMHTRPHVRLPDPRQT